MPCLDNRVDASVETIANQLQLAVAPTYHSTKSTYRRDDRLVLNRSSAWSYRENRSITGIPKAQHRRKGKQGGDVSIVQAKANE
jgi:hypothetical protein